jgi:hypothetical protein
MPAKAGISRNKSQGGRVPYGKVSKHFFFEKKKQKTFMSLWPLMLKPA